jgi:tRNA G18 (ribose-2'-O)-methylase SpoU
VTLSFLPDGVENPANLDRIADVAGLFGSSCSTSVVGRLIAVENAPGATAIYGRRPLQSAATLAVGNERRGLSRDVLRRASETVVIPTASRTVTTLNVAAAAAVAAWYVLRGSGSQAHAARPEHRRPSLLLVGDDHVEVGSSLRSAAAFGFRDVFLEDRGAGWFDGPGPVRREARAAARRHKNPLRIHRATLEVATRFDEILLLTASADATGLARERLARGRRQLVIVGAEPHEVTSIASERMRIASLGLKPTPRPPLRLISSIAMAEIARQVGRRRPGPSEPAVRTPTYERALAFAAPEEVLRIDPFDLLAY